MQGKASTVHIDVILSIDEFNTLLLMLGLATGAAFKSDQTKLAYSFLRLANRMNQGNPDWIPYEISAELTP